MTVEESSHKMTLVWVVYESGAFTDMHWCSDTLMNTQYPNTCTNIKAFPFQTHPIDVTLRVITSQINSDSVGEIKPKHQYFYWRKLDMSTARRRLKSPRSLSGTSAHPTMVKQVNIMVMNGWLTSLSFIVNRLPHFWDKAYSDSDLETPSSSHGCGQRARSYIGPVSY